jgi:hypothetical protein
MPATIKIRRKVDSSKVKFTPLTSRIKKVATYVDENFNGDIQAFLRDAQGKKAARVAEELLKSR